MGYHPMAFEMNKEVSPNSISDLALGKLSPEECLKILERLEEKPGASRELDVASSLLNFVAQEGKEIFEREEEKAFVRYPLLKRIVWKLEDLFGSERLAYPVAAVIVLFGFVAALVAASSLTTSEYYHLTKIETFELGARVRGPGLDDFVMASEAFSKGHYEETKRLLERFIRAFPQSEWVDYAQYSVGGAYLVASKRTFLSLFPSFDHDQVIRGLGHLQAAIQTSTNLRTIESSHWLRAKGYLMLGEAQKALAELRIIVSLKGLKSEQASRLISDIDRVQKGG